jgi:hypothetical protein
MVGYTCTASQRIISKKFLYGKFKYVSGDNNAVKEFVMKKTLFSFLLSIFVLGTSFAQTQIHIIGQEGDDAVYWLNGRRTVLPLPDGFTVYGMAIVE